MSASKCASNVHQRTHRKRSQSQPTTATTTRSQSQPKGVKMSAIIANACVQRTAWPMRYDIITFRYRVDSPPVEPRFEGKIDERHGMVWNPRDTPWYLNVRRLLHLNRVSVKENINYMTMHCFRTTRGSSKYEFGRHVYANKDGYLLTFEMWKPFRNSDRLFHSQQHTINDVLPRLSYATDVNGTRFDTITAIAVTTNQRSVAHAAWDFRWWYKYGRECFTRVWDWKSIDDFVTNGLADRPGGHWNSLKRDRFFGVYVGNKAKLIMRDVITKPDSPGVDEEDNNGTNDYNDYNHTLVQSGVFIAVQGECSVVFMDNTTKVYSLRDLRSNVTTSPIIVLSAVPSVGESVCWGLTIQGKLRNAANKVIGTQSILNVPLLGMNRDRLQVCDWEQGYQYVNARQQTFDYSQFVRQDTNFRVSDDDIRSVQFASDEPLEYPRIEGARFSVITHLLTNQ